MANGWTPERRPSQAAQIGQWKPWLRSTGPRTEAGKAISAMNARKHGMRGRAARDEARVLRNLIRACGEMAREV
jgi:hypothetical protein